MARKLVDLGRRKGIKQELLKALADIPPSEEEKLLPEWQDLEKEELEEKLDRGKRMTPAFPELGLSRKKIIAIALVLVIITTIIGVTTIIRTSPSLPPPLSTEDVFTITETPEPEPEKTSEIIIEGENPTKIAPPPIPEEQEAIDAGNTPWKGPAQWLQLTLLVACVLQFAADAGQRFKKASGDWGKIGAFLSPLFVVFATSLVIWGDKEWAVAILGTDPLARILLVLLVGFLLAKGDLSLMATPLAFIGLLYSNMVNKEMGLLLEFLKVGPDKAVLWAPRELVNLISHNMWGEAKFTLAILVLVTIALVLFLAELSRAKPTPTPSFILGIGGGITLAVVTNLIPQFSVIFGFILLAATAAVINFDKENWDEGVGLAVCFAALVNFLLAKPPPIP